MKAQNITRFHFFHFVPHNGILNPTYRLSDVDNISLSPVHKFTSPPPPPPVSPPRSPHTRLYASGSTVTPILSTPTHPNTSGSPKPTHLSFHKGKTRGSVDSSPSSPMMTVTSVDGCSMQYDSGKDSMTSDNSDHSNRSEHHQELIKLESPTSTTAPKSVFDLAEFDPLQGSHDSLLYDPYTGKTSGNSSPNAASGSPQTQLLACVPANAPRHGQASPKLSPRQSITLETPPILGPSPNIARPRPRPTGLPTQGDPSHPVSAPSSRPHSPRNLPPVCHQRSPTGSVHSLVQFPTQYDSDFPGSFWFQSDSETTSTTSSLLDLTEIIDDPHPPLIPSLSEFDIRYATFNLPHPL